MSMSTRIVLPSQGLRLPARPTAGARRAAALVVRAENKDSYEKLEAPVRPESSPLNVGPKVSDRQSEADEFLKSDTANPDRALLNSDVGFLDAMRFKGSAPEIINCRLAMLGFVAAVAAERVAGINVFEQVNIAPVPIALTFLTFTIASLVPMYRGVKRSGNGFWTPDAELWNGRAAMIGMVAVVINTYVRGSVF